MASPAIANPGFQVLLDDLTVATKIRCLLRWITDRTWNISSLFVPEHDPLESGPSETPQADTDCFHFPGLRGDNPLK